MFDKQEIKPIAYIRTDFKEKFGIPRQSGRAPTLTGRIIFLPEYRNPDALRGLTEFSHIWLLFDFSESHRKDWSATVRPPRLGGNTRVGVFASRSPFRPNPIGLSSVRLDAVEKTEKDGEVLLVSGVDLLDMTPIYDIKPYLPFADCHPDAVGGYADGVRDVQLRVNFLENCANILPEEKKKAATECLAEDPRPAYQDDPERIYSMNFSGYDICFRVSGDVLTVVEIRKTD